MNHKFFRLTTIPSTLENLLKGQLSFLNQYYDITAIADGKDTKKWEIIEEREKIRCHPNRTGNILINKSKIGR